MVHCYSILIVGIANKLKMFCIMAMITFLYQLTPTVTHSYFNWTQNSDNQTLRGQDMYNLLDLMGLEEGATMILIHDCELGLDVKDALRIWTSRYRVFMMSLHFSRFDEVISNLIEDLIKRKNVNIYRSVLNFLVFLNDGCLTDQRLYKMIQQIDSKYGKRALLRHFSKWLFICSANTSENTASTDTMIDNIALVLMDTSVQQRNSTDIHMSIHTLLWKPNGRRWFNVGYMYHEDNHFNITASLFPNTRYGLNGRQLVIGTMEWGEFCRKSPSSQEEPISYTQVCRDLMEYLGTSFNFSYKFVEPPDQSWGEMLPNSSWRGLLGMIVRDEIDLLGVPYGTTMQRNSFLSFSHMIMSTRYQICYKKQHSEGNSWISLLSCFKWEVYVCGLIAFVWCVSILGIIERPDTENTKESIFLCSGHMSQTILTGIAVPLHQATVTLPKKGSGRFLFTSWWFFCIIITAVYTGNLTALLAVTKEKTPFTNLDELVKNDQYEIIIVRGSYLETQMKHSNLDLMKTLWRKIRASRRDKSYSSMEEYEHYKELLRSGQYALIEISDSIDDMELSVPDLRRTKRDIMTLYLSLPFPLNSPLEPLFSEKLMHLYDSGVVEGLRRRWAKRKNLTESYQTSALQLQLSDFQSAFTACAIGVFLAAICLSLERIYMKYRHKASHK